MSSNFKPIKVQTKIVENDEVIQIQLVHDGFPISLALFRESGKAFIEVNDNYQYIELDLNNGTKDIRLFQDQDKYIIMYPTFTEEFFSPGLVRVSKNGDFEYLGDHNYKFEDYANGNKGKKGSYRLKEINDTIRVFYSQKNTETMLRETDFNPVANESITLEELHILKALTDKGKSSLIKNWKGNYTLEFDLIRDMTDYNWKFSLQISDANAILVRHTFDNGTESIENLVIKSNSPNELVLISPTDENSEYILTLEGNNFYISGMSIYLMNPPNERYQVYKKSSSTKGRTK